MRDLHKPYVRSRRNCVAIRYEMCVASRSMRTQLRSLVLAAAALATQPFLSAAPPPAARAHTYGGRPIVLTANDARIVDTRPRRSLWLTFVDGAARDIDGEWGAGGHVTVLRRASASSDEPIYRDVVYRSVWRGI